MTRTRFFALLAVPGLALGLAHGTSQARSLLPSAGRAVNAVDYSCFWLENSAMTNACAEPKHLEIPITMDSDGLFPITVTAIGATTANNVGCLAVGTNKAGWTYAGPDPRQQLSVLGMPTDQTTRAWHWGGGGVFVDCEVMFNGRVLVVNW